MCQQPGSWHETNSTLHKYTHDLPALYRHKYVQPRMLLRIVITYILLSDVTTSYTPACQLVGVTIH